MNQLHTRLFTMASIAAAFAVAGVSGCVGSDPDFSDPSVDAGASSSSSGSGAEGGASSSSSGDVSSSSGSSGTPGSTSGSSGAPDGGGSSSGGVTCTELTTGAYTLHDGGGGAFATYWAPVIAEGVGTIGNLSFSVYNPAGAYAGTFDLSQEADFQTCTHCFLIVPTEGLDENKTIMQSEGSLAIADGHDPYHGTVSATVTGLTLVESILEESGPSKPVVGGYCYHVSQSAVSVPAGP